MLAQFSPVGAIALCSFFYHVQAAPSLSPKSASQLVKRFNTFIGCDDNQRNKAGQAAADMANLALHAFDQASIDSYG